MGKVAQHVRDEGTVPRINKEEDPDPEYSEYLEEAALIPNQAKVLVKDVKRLLERVLETHIESWIPGRVTAKS